MKCIVCGNNMENKLKKVYEYNTELFCNLFPNLIILRCDNCSLTQINIENNDENNQKLVQYYEKTYRENEQIPKLDDENSWLYHRGIGIAKLLYSKYKKRGEGVSVFEKGCGYGFNLKKIKEYFPNASLYTDELDLHTKLNLETIGVKEINNIDEKKFDIIIISHVLEHLTNPNETLDWCHKHLIESGLLYIEVPNSLHFVEPHITFWDTYSLKKYYYNYLSEKFELLEYYTTGYPYYYKGRLNKKKYKKLKKTISPLKMMNCKTRNGVFLRMLLKKRNT